MLIYHHAHSEFLIETAQGFRILTDPFDEHVGYPMGTYRADAVTVSHGHGDHNYISKATGTPAVIDKAGEWYPAPDVKVTAIPSVHDMEGGAKRGPNLIMKIEMDGLTVVHLGDQGAPLTADQIKAIKNADILMIPIGGFFTIDSKTAYETVQAVKPRMVIPMHYKTAVNAGWPISDEKEFLRLMNAQNVSPMPLLRVTKQDLSEQPALAMMQAKA